MNRDDHRTPGRGEVWRVAFEHSIGGEIKKTRPAIIVSNDTANQLLNRVQVVPVTSKVAKLYPAEAYVTVKGRRRKAMADQITTASKLRLRNRIGILAPAELGQVERVIKVQLGLF